MIIVGITGFKSSGKNEVANIFRDHGFRIISMADCLKDMVSATFSLDRQLLEGTTIESREWREYPLRELQWLAGQGVFKNDLIITPRLVLQRFGTDLIRDNVSPNFWLHCLKMRISKLEPCRGVVIPDTRFLNELQFCDVTVRIQRNIPSVSRLKSMHISETDHLRFQHHYTIINDGSLTMLRFRAEEIIGLILNAI